MTKKVRENGKGVCDRRDEHDETSLSRAGVSSSLQAKHVFICFYHFFLTNLKRIMAFS